MVRTAHAAVARWAEFPADVDPRPFVLLHGPVRSEKGFATREAKAAFLCGQIGVDPGVPAEVTGFLRVPRAHIGSPRRGRLQLTAAMLAETYFATDRGDQLFPAWRVDAVDALGPIWVLTSEVQSRCWSRLGALDGEWFGPHVLSSATVGSDGRELTVTFIGGRERLFRYDVVVVESPAAVSIAPLERATEELPHGQFYTFEGHSRTVKIRLAAPLGGRVIANLDGTPVPVSLGRSGATGQGVDACR